MPKRIPAPLFTLLVLTAILVTSLWGLAPRLSVEKENRDVAIIADWRDIPPLAQSAGISSVAALEKLKQKGLRGLMVGEFSGEEILDGLSPVEMEPTTALQNEVGDSGTFFFIPGSLPFASELAELVALRAGTPSFAQRGGIGVIDPVPMDSLRKSGVVPDLEGLKAGTEAQLPIFYRMAPAQTWQLRQSLEVARRILTAYPNIALVAPSGEIALGYPDMRPLASLLKERDVPAAQIEFSRQPGASALNRLAFPNFLPLHSVTNEELLARRIDRTALHERLTRAATERSVRVLLIRPAVSGNVDSPLGAFASEIAALSDSLTTRGFRMEWPKTVFSDPWPMSFVSAVSCALALVLSAFRLLKRGHGAETASVAPAGAVSFLLVSFVLAVAIRKFDAAASLLAALTSAFVVTEASLIAMNVTGRNIPDGSGVGQGARFWKAEAKAFFFGFLFALIGGLSLAALFGIPVYMLRLRTFSGVKLTLMLPLLLVFLHDLRRRIHPESLTELLSRPPLFGELFLGMFLLLLMGIVLFRSDNVQFIPGIEAKIRNTLERVLVARPRNREIFIGYPCLLIYAFAVREGLWIRWRELFRLGVVTGFASVVNSFCHFHTPLLLTLLREFHGLWVGLLLGTCCVIVLKYAVLPFWRSPGGRFFRFLAE